jgi:putative SOS response-associated peptidase YedK
VRYPGTYNARRDNLDGFWSGVYGRHQAVLVINGFYENVALHDYERRELRPGEKRSNLVLNFSPKPAVEMLVACLWDRWSGAGEELYSFAAITDEPPPEISATGHERCVIAIREQNLDDWLDPARVDAVRLKKILDDRESFYYEHKIYQEKIAA